MRRRFNEGDIVTLENNNGVSDSLDMGDICVIVKGNNGDNLYLTNWTRETYVDIINLSDPKLKIQSGYYNYRFKLYEGEIDGCIICASSCKREEKCALFESLIDVMKGVK